MTRCSAAVILRTAYAQLGPRQSTCLRPTAADLPETRTYKATAAAPNGMAMHWTSPACSRSRGRMGSASAKALDLQRSGTTGIGSRSDWVPFHDLTGLGDS